jgi:predicted permease
MKSNRALRWLLTRLSSRDAADATIGDILEELHERRAAGQAPPWPLVWLTLRLLRAIAAAAVSATPQVLRSAGHTLRDAARSLRRAPAQPLFILAILSVAISAATVTFSVVDAVMLKPLPYEHSERLVMVSAEGLDRWTLTSPEAFQAVRDQVPGLESLGSAFFMSGGSIDVGSTTEHSLTAQATAEYFRVLGVNPVLGRVWTDEDARRGDVAVLGFEFWQSHFGGASSALGQALRVMSRTYRVVGVLPSNASRPGGDAVAVWLPRSKPSLPALARMRPGVTTDVVAAQVRSALAPIAKAHGAAFAPWQPDVHRWDATLVGDSRGWLVLILSIVLVVVLIACVNVANVLLTRSAERAHDLAIRASLGASRRHLAASLLAESVLVSLAACASALLVASWAMGAVKHVLPPLFRANTIALDGRVFLASLAAASITGTLSGLVPAWQASRASVVDLLKDAGLASPGRRRWRSAFLVSQIAGVGMLLVVATLFIASFLRVTSINLGFERSNLLAESTLSHYPGNVGDVKRRLEGIRGIVGAAAVTNSMPPLVGHAYGGAYFDTELKTIDGSAKVMKADLMKVTSNYFAVAGISFRSGSTWADDAIESHPIVLDEATARGLFPTGSALGRSVVVPELIQGLNAAIFRVVGVIPSERQAGPEEDWPSAYYAMPVDAHPIWVGFIMRTSVPPDSLVRTVQASLDAIAPPSGSTGTGVHVVDEAYRRLTAKRRFNASLMTAFAIFAVFVGAAGIYAVMASIVAQQTKEIGVRVALGATPGDIRRSVLTRAGGHVFSGLAIGLPAGWLISRGFASFFFQVKPTDASIYVIVAMTIGVVAVVAAIVPARRAANVDPVISLRTS